MPTIAKGSTPSDTMPARISMPHASNLRAHAADLGVSEHVRPDGTRLKWAAVGLFLAALTLGLSACGEGAAIRHPTMTVDEARKACARRTPPLSSAKVRGYFAANPAGVGGSTYGFLFPTRYYAIHVRGNRVVAIKESSQAASKLAFGDGPITLQGSLRCVVSSADKSQEAQLVVDRVVKSGR